MEPYIRRIRRSSKQFGKKTTLTETIGYEGFCIDLLNAISKIVGFSFEIYEVEDGRFGAFDEKTGEWHGLIREIIDKVFFSKRISQPNDPIYTILFLSI